MRVILVHRWDGNPESDWYPWLKKELGKRSLKLEIPEMPETSVPKIDSWVSHLEKTVGKSREEIIFIGHSVGCQAILRFLEKTREKLKIKSIIFVAGFFALQNLEDDGAKEIAMPWLTTPIDFSKVKAKVSDISVFLSTNDPFVSLKENSGLFRKNLGAKILIQKNMGHFTSDDNVAEFPEILKLIKN